jgi:endogenous inhibitor of DNA gyrase (YacG/DUF329 family)
VCAAAARAVSIFPQISVSLASLADEFRYVIFLRAMSDKPIRRCPQCRRETSWEDNPWKPFCSERCQMIDLGHWAAEDYRVPLAETPDGVTTDFDREHDADEQSKKR